LLALARSRASVSLSIVLFVFFPHNILHFLYPGLPVI
jgi:hypothetical protein